MIKLRDVVPTVYTDASRDFQYLSWLINIVLNSVKHNVDDMYYLPSTKADPRLTELLAMTLGFKVKRNYDKEQLTTLVSILPSIMKHKGTLEAVSLASKALLQTSGSDGSVECKINNNCLEVRLPEALVDISLFTDLLPYILPAGLTYRIIRDTIPQEALTPIQVDIDFDTVYANWHSDLAWDDTNHTTAGLANMFDIDAERQALEFSNYRRPIERDELGLPVNINVGLIDNSIIPTLTDTVLTDNRNEAEE